MVTQERENGLLNSPARFFASKEAHVVVGASGKGKDLKSHLVGVSVGLKVPGLHRQSDSLGKTLAPFLMETRESLAHRTGTVIVLSRAGQKGTTPLGVTSKPEAQDFQQSGQTARSGQSGNEHFITELLSGQLQGGQLQFFT